jgi:hypothetical protein
MTRKKFFGKALLQYIKTQPPGIEFDDGMGDARCGEARGTKQFAAQLLIQIARIFERVVQVNFAEAVKALTRTKPVTVQGKRRFAIDIWKLLLPFRRAATSRRTFVPSRRVTWTYWRGLLRNDLKSSEVTSNRMRRTAPLANSSLSFPKPGLGQDRAEPRERVPKDTGCWTAFAFSLLKCAATKGIFLQAGG